MKAAGTGETVFNEFPILNFGPDKYEDEEESNCFLIKRETKNVNKTLDCSQINNLTSTQQNVLNLKNNSEMNEEKHAQSFDQIEKLNKIIKILILSLASICTCLDGYILIFLGYNSSILTKNWGWRDNTIFILELIYHLVSAFGGVVSIFTCKISNKNGLKYGIIFLIFSFFFSLPLLNIKICALYMIIFSIICLSNGHLQNISTTLIVKIFSPEIRASVYVFAYFFTQFGKFMFACIIYKFNEKIQVGQLTITVFPILIMIIFQITVVLLLIKYKSKKSDLKGWVRYVETQDGTYNGQTLITLEYTGIIIGLPQWESNINLYQIFVEPLIELISTYRFHIYNLIFLNLSLGIQFFSMINVFPLLKNKSFVIIVDEILVSKAYHTIFLLFLPLLFLFRDVTRKFLLTITFTSSLLFNLLILFNIFNSSLMIHFFRFIWNVCFITINLYCAESISKKLRGVNTSLMYLIFKISCVVEILTIDKLISVSIYIPIGLNILIIIGDLLLVNKLQIETHMKSVEAIEKQTKTMVDCD